MWAWRDAADLRGRVNMFSALVQLCYRVENLERTMHEDEGHRRRWRKATGTQRCRVWTGWLCGVVNLSVACKPPPVDIYIKS